MALAPTARILFHVKKGDPMFEIGKAYFDARINGAPPEGVKRLRKIYDAAVQEQKAQMEAEGT